MAIAYKVLGQSNPTIYTMTQLYVVPTGANTIVSTLAICNQAVTATTVNVAVIPGGGTLTSQNYIMANTALAANDTITLTMGMTMGASDVLSVSTGSSTVSFTAFGSEIR
jgi:hypothetical protein